MRTTGLRFVNADDVGATLGIDAYEAARVADALRRQLVVQRVSFIFETVFSDPIGEKVSFLADDKITARYRRSLANLKRAIATLPVVIVFDNDDLHTPFRRVAGLKQLERDLAIVLDVEAVPPMRRAVERALALDPSSAEAHAQAGVLHMWYDWDPVSARRELERALALDSANVTAATYYSLLLSAEFADLGDSSVAVIERGVRLNPGSVIMLRVAVDEEPLRRLSPMQREPRCLLLERLQASPAIGCTVRRLRLDGRADSARRVRLAALRRMTTAEHEGLSGTNLIIRAEVFLGAADTASARIELNAAILRSAREYVREDVIAIVYFLLGDVERSVQWWERAVDSNGGRVLYLLHKREFEPLRRDPRAQDVIRKARARQRS